MAGNTLSPFFRAREVLVNDGSDSKTFYEGLAPGEAIPYASWVEPLCWWAVFLLALYVTMVSVAVIVRRQWMERERPALSDHAGGAGDGARRGKRA